MKNIILGLATLILSAQAQAEELTATLNVFRIEPASTLSHLAINKGTVTVDTGAKTIRLQLGDKQFLTPLVKTELDACGSIIHTGLDAPAPGVFDGITTMIKVQDNRDIVCRILLPDTQVELAITGGFAGFNEKHEMEGSKLQARFIRAALTQLNFQPHTQLAQEGFQQGEILVDTADQIISLTLFKAKTCHGHICLPVVPERRTISLPLEETIQYRCNVVDYISKVYQAQRGGPLHQLKLRVSGPTRCISTQPVYNADVTLEIFGFVHETHHLQGRLD